MEFIQQIKRAALHTSPWPSMRDIAIFWGIGLIYGLIEYKWPARKMVWRKAIAADLFAYFLILISDPIYVIFITALTACIPGSAYLEHVSSPLKYVLIFVLSDFLVYWIHRAKHTRWLWRVHQWHHAPQQLYWLAGIRASLVDGLASTIPMVLMLSMFRCTAIESMVIWLIAGPIMNGWMHLNSHLGRSLEMILVTPQVHRLHHSGLQVHYNKNFGSFFTFWDRLFGTYVSPGPLEDKFPVGLETPGTAVGKIRRILGV